MTYPPGRINLGKSVPGDMSFLLRRKAGKSYATFTLKMALWISPSPMRGA